MAVDKESLIYEQNCQEFRSLNGFFWQVPLIMMTLNGGLWYSVASLDLDTSAQRGVLFFAVLANMVMVVGLWRLRSVMQSLLTDIHKFQGTKPSGKARLIQYLFQALLVFAAAGAFAASFNPEEHFTKQLVDEKKKAADPARPDHTGRQPRAVHGKPAS